MKKNSPTDPPHGYQSNNYLFAAVRGFVVSSDRDLLMSKKKSVTKRYQCYICDENFAIARVCETHKMLEHKVPVPWKCTECGMQFLHGTQYNFHMVQSHQAKAYVCGIDSCPAIFHSSAKLMAHKYDCHNISQGKEKMVYKCQFCHEQFLQQSRLKYHMRIHTGEEPFKCLYCSRTFRSSSHRNMHMKATHITDKIRSHLCDWCGKKFFNARQLQSHVQSHTAERPYPCPLCPRTFSKNNTMRVHMRQHTGEKPYVCDQCGQAFTVRVSLRTHLRSKHNITVDLKKVVRRETNPDSSVPALGRPRKQNVLKTVIKEKS